MTDKKTEALKLALERLEWFVESYPHDITTNKEEFLRPFKEALAHAPTVREQPAQDNTYNYAKSLAEAIFKQHFASDEHYASGRIVWGVNDTVIGILTQIDNMVADMVRRPAQQQEPVAWRDHVEQRLLTWKQSFVNKSGDQLALDDFMDKQSLDDLIDFVCDEYTPPQPAQQQEQKLEFVSPGGGYVPAIPKPIPLDWKLVPRKATPEMLKAMDECAQEGYDERLYAGMASSVYMAAWDASPVMGTLPEQPAQQQEPVAIDRLYIEALIEGLYQNEDPVSIDAAEEFERLLKTPASPPASKPWVGLTDWEREKLRSEADEEDAGYTQLIKATEAKLREKNA